MKKILILACTFVLACGTIGYSQKYTRNGDVIEKAKSEKMASESIKTKFKYRTNDGKEYPIYKSPKGAYYIIKVSKKTGKEYKQYLGKEINEYIHGEI